MIDSVDRAAAILRGDRRLVDDSLLIDCGGFLIRVRSDSAAFIEQLSVYFRHVAAAGGDADITIEAYDTEGLQLDLDWRDWAREPGKSGRKDAYVDLPGGRLLLKVRTGMLFLQSREALIAAGPCRRLDNQVINFINSQYMNWLQNNGWLICHAAALQVGRCGLGIAGLSGGGKSTLMLGLMDYDDTCYVTNDRLFIRPDAGALQAAGIPKMPRINPGTIVHNPALHGLIDTTRRRELCDLPGDQLWHLEDKHDVMIAEVYGPGRICPGTVLQAFLVLNWSRDNAEDTRLVEVELESRRDLLPAIMKSPGPFYQMADGRLYSDSMQQDEQAYLNALQDVRLVEARGRVDTELLKKEIHQWITTGLANC